MMPVATVIERQDLLVVSAERIRELRQSRGWSQLELSCATGVTQSTISRLESGRLVRVKRATLERLAKGLNASVVGLRSSVDRWTQTHEEA